MSNRDDPEIRFVTREPWIVDQIETANVPESMRYAWSRLEAIVGSLRGHRMAAAMNVATGRYRVCVRSAPDSVARAGTTRGEVAGGRYALVRLTGAPPGLYRRIAPAFERLAAACPIDSNRESIEDYRRHDTVDCLLPVLDDRLRA